MFPIELITRAIDRKPWVAHLYVTDQCNLDCAYCNEYDNSFPHAPLADLKKWMDKIRALGVARLGLQGGEPLKHPDIAEVVRYAKSLGFYKVSMSSNAFLLTRDLLRDLEDAGLDSFHISVDRMTPVTSTRKSMKSVLHKLDWFANSPIKLNVSGVLFRDSLDEVPTVIDTCLDRGIGVHARAVHDDLIQHRTLRDAALTEPILKLVEQQETLKRNGAKIHTNWNLFRYEKAMLRGEPLEWTCTAGYKYFYVSARGKFWLCNQVRTDRHILDITPEDLCAYNVKKSCQAGCGVYCIVDTSHKVNHPLRYLARDVIGSLRARFSRMRGDLPQRMRDLPSNCLTSSSAMAQDNHAGAQPVHCGSCHSPESAETKT
ncbi:MAG TPA: radical SAM protein [Chthoniobacterales bacterium]|jgi:MoaA/NifB/PqqE/SkfB family radical SAM enzyme|nr:radical SAM protein [Chthoniobacterales bacterium]